MRYAQDFADDVISDEGIGLLIANQLLWDIKNGKTDIRTIENIGLSKEFIDSWR